MLLRLWWLPVAAIFILSVVPASFRPVLGPHVVEHAAAFGIAGTWVAAAKRQPLWVLLGTAAAFACAIEFMQLFVHGRHARLHDLVIDLIAAGVGTMIGYAIRPAATAATDIND
jgi:hypothetical protein